MGEKEWLLHCLATSVGRRHRVVACLVASQGKNKKEKGLAPWGVGNCGALLPCLLLWWR
jgi:hypothetical protein